MTVSSFLPGSIETEPDVFWVAADLHLSVATPGLAALFLQMLADLRDRATRQSAPPALYLLGDIFEYWAGDDDLDDAFNRTMVNALRQTTAAGIEVGFLPGNRDFLIGQGFASASGVRLLPDPFILSLPSWQFALTHGDSFCTDDLDYQRFRDTVRHPDWQARFLAQPLAARKQQIEAIRRQSEMTKQDKSNTDPGLMDVNRNTVEDFLHDQGYPTLIHGHTHRPMTHQHIVDGIHCERWVLADWRESPDSGTVAQGEILAWNGAELSRRPLR